MAALNSQYKYIWFETFNVNWANVHVFAVLHAISSQSNPNQSNPHVRISILFRFISVLFGWHCAFLFEYVAVLRYCCSKLNFGLFFFSHSLVLFSSKCIHIRCSAWNVDSTICENKINSLIAKTRYDAIQTNYGKLNVLGAVCVSVLWLYGDFICYLLLFFSVCARASFSSAHIPVCLLIFRCAVTVKTVLDFSMKRNNRKKNQNETENPSRRRSIGY